MKRTTALMLSILMSMSAFAADPASPQGTTKRTTKRQSTSSVSAEIEQMKEALAAQQRQIEELKQQVSQRDQAIQQTQQQLNQLQSATQAATSKADEAAAASSQASEAANGLKTDVSDLKTNSTAAATELQETQKRIGNLESPLAIHYKGVTITPGAFLAAETVWRQRGTLGDINTPFSSIPFPGSNTYNTSEFYGSARQSRLSLLVQGKISDVVDLTGYYETDWLGTGITSNNNQSNSYVNRMRQLYGQAAFHNGWTVTGGQMWSLVTETKKGLDNRTEALPMTIDPQYTVGFSWAREYGLRVTKNINNKAWVGFSVENPQTTLSVANANANFLFGGPGTGGGLYNPTANYSLNYIPDFVGKVAFEPGFGHYEVFGLMSDFRTRVYPGATATTPTAAGAYNTTQIAGGAGANARWTFAKKVDLGLHFLGGNGIGRYGTTGLPDVTVDAVGNPVPLMSLQGLATLEFHTKHWDIYFNGGEEYVDRNFVTVGTKQIGYGVLTANATGCTVEVLPGAGGFTPNNAANCSVATRAMAEGTVGFWYKAYAGPKGRLQLGTQYSYLKRMTWQGVGGSPSTNDNMFLTSFRYYLP